MNLESERNYCLKCINMPCSKGCPLGNNIPAFIHENDYQKAFEMLSQTTVLPAICGRICPHYSQCEGNCIRGIKNVPVSIGKIETDIGDVSIEKQFKIPGINLCEFLREEYDENIKNIEGKKVAIIGGGPSGLTAAAFLARLGIKVTIFERHSKLGGILQYGIPNFRLPKDIVQKTIKKIMDIGNIDVKLKCSLGKEIKLEELKKEYDAILLAFGANVSSKMNIMGEELEGVYGANEVLEYNSDIDVKNKNVSVIGGGNVAMDIARTLKRNGAKRVTVIYRRAEEQMPADRKEIEIAKKEGIEFLFQNNIVKILEKNKKGKVGQIECIKTELVKKDGENRLSPVNIKGSNYFIDMDMVFRAIGSVVEDSLVKNLNIKLTKYENIEVNELFETSNENIFACGDLAGQKSTVAWAARSGREAAKTIVKKLGRE